MLVGIISSCVGGSTAADCSGTFKTHVLQIPTMTFSICDWLRQNPAADGLKLTYGWEVIFYSLILNKWLGGSRLPNTTMQYS